MSKKDGYSGTIDPLLLNFRVDASDDDNSSIVETSTNEYLEIVGLLLRTSEVNLSLQANVVVINTSAKDTMI